MRSLLTALTFVGMAAPALSQTMVPGGSITLIRTGWDSESFGIVTVEPIANPASCPIPDGYVSDGSQPGYNTHYAAALTAFVAKEGVVVSLHNTQCIGGRPKIIGINMGGH